MLPAYSETSDRGGRANWRKIAVKLFEADLGWNDAQVPSLHHEP